MRADLLPEHSSTLFCRARREIELPVASHGARTRPMKKRAKKDVIVRFMGGWINLTAGQAGIIF